MRHDQKDIQNNLQRFSEEAQKLHDIANTYVEKKNAEVAKMEATINEEKSLNEKFDAQKAEAQSSQDRRRDMMNDRNKELLSVNDKNLAAIKADNSGLGDYLLSQFACIITNDENNTRW